MNSSLSPYIIGLDWHLDDAGLISVADACTRVGGNTGNLAFSYAVSRHLGLTRANPTRWMTLPKEIKKSKGHAGIFAMANVIGSHVDLCNLANEYEDVCHNLSIVGIGAQAAIGADSVDIPDGTLRFLNIVSKKGVQGVPNIAVRGDFTHRVLIQHGLGEHCVSLGCPSLFISSNPRLGDAIALNAQKKIPVTLAVCAAHYRWTHLARIESRLIGLVDQFNGIYIMQSPLEMLYLASNEIESVDNSIVESCRISLTPSKSHSEFISWMRTHAVSFYSAAEWMKAIRQYQFVVGFRIHGVMLALQAGIPGICLVHDSRTLELCQKMMVPYLMSEEIPEDLSLDYLWSQFVDRFNPQIFDQNRQDLSIAYIKFLESNRFCPSDDLRRICSLS